MIAEERARFTIQSLLARGLGAAEVARRSGLARASEVWGGDEPLDRAAWYVWLDGAPGAYKLELEDAGAAQEQAWHARFTIRYYPHHAEAAFRRFSAEERAVIQEGLVDATGTPRIEVAAAIPRGLFVVGSLEWEAGTRDATTIGLSALDRSIVRDGGGAVLRDVPGWTCGVGLLRALAGLHALTERQAVRRIRLARQPGFELVLAGSDARWRDTVDAVHGHAALRFAPPDVPFPHTEGPFDAADERDVEVVADERFDGGCRHPPALESDPRIGLAVSHAWFGGESIAEDRIACAC